MPKIAISDVEIANCFEVMSELRPHLVKESFVSMIREMENNGYQLAFIKSEGVIAAVAGFRISTNLIMGKHFYVEDLVVKKSIRSKGLGGILMKWLESRAQNEGCINFHLDSGTQRGDAHRFYFKHDFSILAYHFAKKL
ncbi:MAG: GNAT family N-acetyltransferase [Desulforhopalus sp.]